MKQAIVVIGLGEMGSVFARGLLRLGHPLYPVIRGTALETVAQQVPDPLLVLVAVAENDLHPVLENIPTAWQRHIVLLQNELLPKDWQQYEWSKAIAPTVISVWFEKKKGQDSKVLIPSPVYGGQAQTIHDALATLDIPVTVLKNSEQLELELVIKNVYILTTNIAGLALEKMGLETAANVETLWQKHQDLAKTIANEVIDIQECLTGKTFNRDTLIKGMHTAMLGDPEHKCMGRSAPARLERALKIAKDAALNPAQLLKIAST
ncbi:hypothetical protein MNBD_GAMMA23-1682 [hydrothermal vent metagenome]|uniref:2-dehydropantoate 2-reductase n=1 Tax=hydrothermal vent metagenome TaxID=652676 RepID=A0A3B0ZNW4_9ZZZZ